MYIVTNIRENGRKLRITFNEEIVLQLYKGEARRFHIAMDATLTETEYGEICEILSKRARERALYLLKDMDKSEKQIRDKLKAGDYPAEIIEDTILFLKKYDYVNDNRYARLYIEAKKEKKSIKQIEAELYKRGINTQIIQQALEECDVTNDMALRMLIEKKKKQYDFTDRTQYNKVYRFLLGKGFSYDEITNALEKYRHEEWE